jgi:Flp pilus assembly protein TadD
LEKGARFIEEGKFSDAISKLNKAVELLPKNAQAWNQLGLAYHYSGDPVKARQAYSSAINVDRNLPVVRYNVGCLFYEQQNFAAAVPELTSFVVLEPKNAEGWLKLGAAQLHQSLQLSGAEKTKVLEAARKSFESSVNLVPTPEAFNYLGILETQRNRPRDAVRYFNSALQKEANYPAALLNAAVIYQTQLNDHRAALQKYRQFLSSQPRSSRLQQVEELVKQLESEPGIMGSILPDSAAGAKKKENWGSQP